MTRQLYGLTGKDRNNIIAGNKRANNNPLGKSRPKTERRVTTASGDTYNGYFKAINTSDGATQKIKIIDGFDAKNENCGKMQVNKLNSQDIPVAELTITKTTFIYRKTVAIFNEETPPVMTSATVTFEQSEDFPEWEANITKEVKSRIIIVDGKITSFSNEPLSSRVNIIGAC